MCNISGVLPISFEQQATDKFYLNFDDLKLLCWSVGVIQDLNWHALNILVLITVNAVILIHT